MKLTLKEQLITIGCSLLAVPVLWACAFAAAILAEVINYG